MRQTPSKIGGAAYYALCLCRISVLNHPISRADVGFKTFTMSDIRHFKLLRALLGARIHKRSLQVDLEIRGNLCYSLNMVVTIKTDQLTGPMPIFLMASISRGGLNTLYALQQATGLQPGSLAHVIKALMGAAMLERSEGAKRGRRAMALTDAGAEFLVKEWRNSLDARREMESVLRSATVALLMGDIGEACRLLVDSIAKRPPQQGHQELETISPERTPIDFHAAMRAFYLNQRRVMEASVLERFADSLKRSAAT